MENFFNEISTRYPLTSEHAALLQMEGFVKLLKKTKEEGFTKCRVPVNFESISLCNNFTVYNWLSDSPAMKSSKDFYLSFRKYPYETGVEEEENKFIEADYYLNEPQETLYNGNITEGLAWAYVCEGLSISFPVNVVWRKMSINLVEKKNGATRPVNVNHASDVTQIVSLMPWINSIKAIVLRPSGIDPKAKYIHLSDDHGKDKLKAVADILVNCPYVIRIPQSLPYNRTGRSFIKEVYANGRIDITLFDEDAGYSMMIETTGGNLRETQAIAEILKEMY